MLMCQFSVLFICRRWLSFCVAQMAIVEEERGTETETRHFFCLLLLLAHAYQARAMRAFFNSNIFSLLQIALK